MRFTTYVTLIASLVSGRICCEAQKRPVDFPEKLVIVQHSFIDIGPPNDFYELIQLSATRDDVSVERVLITPEGQACISPAKVETRNAILHKSMSDLLEGKNPCQIPEKELHRERKRCKKCLVFSGMNVTMQASCAGKLRSIQMDVLDRDLFDTHANTPENTSWTMKVLEQIDAASGPGWLDTPIFSTSPPAPAAKIPETDTIRALREGRFDSLFGREALISQIVSEAEQAPPPPPTVTLVSSTLDPSNSVRPSYPPIARAARVEGDVKVEFDVDSSGMVKNVRATAGSKLLQGAAVDAVSRWTFPLPSGGKSGDAVFRYQLNCSPTLRTNVSQLK